MFEERQFVWCDLPSLSGLQHVPALSHSLLVQRWTMHSFSSSLASDFPPETLMFLLMLSGLHISSYRLSAVVVNCPVQSSPGAHLFLMQPITAFRRPCHLAMRSPSPPHFLPAHVGTQSRSLLSSGSLLRIFRLS